MLVLHGTVQSGVGEGARFMSLDWVREAVRDAVGFDPYPGTLNVRLADGEALRRWREIRQAAGLRLQQPPTAPCGGRLFPVVVANVQAAVVVPDVTRYGDEILEVIAAVHLKGRLGLRDGDGVALSPGPTTRDV